MIMMMDQDDRDRDRNKAEQCPFWKMTMSMFFLDAFACIVFDYIGLCLGDHAIVLRTYLAIRMWLCVLLSLVIVIAGGNEKAVVVRNTQLRE